MSESVPASREALFALLRELARADVPAPARLAAAREAIANGHLGPPSEAFIEDRDGRPISLLVWAAAWNDGEMVELLLRQGASPLAAQGARESVFRAAHRHGPSAMFQLVRRAAREASERSSHHGLATYPGERRYALRTERGVRDLRRAVEQSRKLDVLLVACDLKATARALASLVQAPRREADVASRPVQDAARLLFLYRLKGIDWTIIPLVFETGSPWNVEHVRELAAAGSGVAPMARALASATASRVVHVKYDEHTIYTEHGGIETHRADETSDVLAELAAFVPPMRASTDGYNVRLELLGLEPSDVERVDVIVLQELGEPPIDRTIALPTSAPALVGAPVLLAQGLPAMVPASVAPAKSEAPPLVREPPPIITEPAPSEAPPLVREPPPLIATAIESEPPIADEPPSIVPEPRVSKNAPPPLVREPPPIVAMAMSEEAPLDESPSLTSEPEPAGDGGGET